MNAVRTAARALPAVAWAAAIFALSSQSRLPRPPIAFDGIDKVVHAAVYAVLALLILWAVRAKSPRAVLLSALLATLYGAADEVHQAFVPGRLPDVYDGLADAGGALLMAAVWLRRGTATATGAWEAASPSLRTEGVVE